MSLIDTTTVRCTACNASHPARIRREGNLILGEVDCPKSAWCGTLSKDAELFLNKRRISIPKPNPQQFLLNHIILTETCDCRCPICYMSSAPQCEPTFLSVADAIRQGRRIVENGGRRAVLIGGEPTLHPQLPELIRRLKEICELTVSVATNGVQLSTDATLLDTLIDAGLDNINLQFDSLDQSVVTAMRGGLQVADKVNLVERICKTELDYGLVATVCDRNLNDVPTLLTWAGQLPRLPKYVALQAMCTAGRFVDGERPVTKETIIDTLAESDCMPEVGTEHFWPVPTMKQVGLFVHPDCCRNLYLVRNGTRLSPLDRFVDVASVLESASGMHAFGKFEWIKAIAGAAVKSINWTQFLRDRITPKTVTEKLMLVGMGDFCNPNFIDDACLERCATGVVCDDSIVPACVYYLTRGQT